MPDIPTFRLPNGLTCRRGLALPERGFSALYVDARAHSARVLTSKDTGHSHIPITELVNLSIPRPAFGSGPSWSGRKRVIERPVTVLGDELAISLRDGRDSQ